MVSQELFIEGTVEALNVGVQLRRTGIGVEVSHLILGTRGFKVESELTPVIGLDGRGTIWQNHPRLFQEVCRAPGAVIGAACSKGGSSLGVNTGENIALGAVNESDHGIDFKHTVAVGTPKLLFSLHSVLYEIPGPALQRKT